MVRGSPAPALRGLVSAYSGFREEAPAPVRRREGPGVHAIVLVSFGEAWSIDGNRVESFAAGLHERQVTTEHRGRSFGIQVDLSPPAAHVLFREPMQELADRVVPLEEVLGEPLLAERLYERGDWPDRFALLDSVLARRLCDAPAPSSEISWAWQRLVQTGGRARIGSLAAELGWSRKRIVVRFREEVGLAPKAAARLIRFERARESAERAEARDWARIALECGYYDQSHLINDFRAVTGRSPETFFQDAQAGAD
jgi:AraC-like DNA-binding protein